MTSQRDIQLLRALGRCTGALIFAVFGACWLLLSCAYLRRLHLTAILPICLFAGLLVFTALRMQRRHAAPVLDEALATQKKQQDRAFGIINAITYAAVFLLFLLLPRFGLQNYIFPGFVALVGLHFFPMPPLYRHTANLVIGAFMVLWALFCAVEFKANGNTMAACVALGAGLALWSSSIWALLTAKQLFNEPTPQ